MVMDKNTFHQLTAALNRCLSATASANVWKPYQQIQPHFAPCNTCGVYGHLRKNCPQRAFTQQNYLRKTTSVATPPYLSRSNAPPSVFPHAFLLNSSPRLTQQLKQIPHVWNEIVDKMNKTE